MAALLMAGQVEQIVERDLEEEGYCLVEMERPHGQRGRALRIFIDHRDQGRAVKGIQPRRITIDDCQRATIKLARSLRGETNEDWELEISSPGLLRPLRKPHDFLRFEGWRVQVDTDRPIAGKSSFLGTLLDMRQDQIRLLIDGAEIVVPLSHLKKARLAEEY